MTTARAALAPQQRRAAGRRGGEGVLGQLRFLQCDQVTSGQDSFCVVSKLPIFYVQTVCHLYFSGCLEEEDDVASLFL